MAHPKRKTSKTVKRSRRASWNGKLKMATVHNCPSCGEPKVVHRACPSCGVYNGRVILKVEEA
jgi:large subunit ribosomal protein L32